MNRCHEEIQYPSTWTGQKLLSIVVRVLNLFHYTFSWKQSYMSRHKIKKMFLKKSLHIKVIYIFKLFGCASSSRFHSKSRDSVERLICEESEWSWSGLKEASLF